MSLWISADFFASASVWQLAAQPHVHRAVHFRAA